MVKKIVTCLLLLSLLFSFPVYAQDVEILGTFSDQFELTSDGNALFDIPIMNPGDVWDSNLEIKNCTGEKMQVQLSEVVNKLDDNMLFDVLKVRVEIDGEIFYEGPYNAIPKSDWIVIENGEQLDVKVILEFPGECGNEYQNKKFDSLWKFESKLPEGASSEGGKNEDPVPTGVVRGFYISGMICLGACILFFIIGKKDDDDEKNKKK